MSAFPWNVIILTFFVLSVYRINLCFHNREYQRAYHYIWLVQTIMSRTILIVAPNGRSNLRAYACRKAGGHEGWAEGRDGREGDRPSSFAVVSCIMFIWMQSGTLGLHITVGWPILASLASTGHTCRASRKEARPILRRRMNSGWS